MDSYKYKLSLRKKAIVKFHTYTDSNHIKSKKKAKIQKQGHKLFSVLDKNYAI